MSNKQFCELIHRVNNNWNVCKFLQGKYTKKEGTSSINSLYVNPTSKLIVFSDTSLEEWDFFGNLLNRINFDQKVHHAYCCNDTMVISCTNSLRIYNTSTKKKEYELKELFSYGNRVIANDEYIGVGCWDGAIKVFSSKNGDKIRFFRGHSNPIYAMDLHNDFLLTGSSDLTVKLWNFRQQEELFTIRNHRKTITDICFLPKSWDEFDTSRFISCSKDKTIRIFDTEYAKECSYFTGHLEAVNCIKPLSESRILSGSKDGTIKLWDIRAKPDFCVCTFLSSSSFGGVNSFYVDPFRIISGHDTGSIVIHEFFH